MAKMKRNKNWENLEEKEVKFGNLRSKFWKFEKQKKQIQRKKKKRLYIILYICS